jgi:hypothetical protein
LLFNVPIEIQADEVVIAASSHLRESEIASVSELLGQTQVVGKSECQIVKGLDTGILKDCDRPYLEGKETVPPVKRPQ